MRKEYENLYNVLEEFLDDCDRTLDGCGSIEVSLWYKKINKALDAVYRIESGLPPPPNLGGRPRKNKENS